MTRILTKFFQRYVWHVMVLVWALAIFLCITTLCHAQQQPIPPPLPQAPIVLMYNQGQEPQVVKMPQFAYRGLEPLRKDDRILKAERYSATGRNLYNRILEYHEKLYLRGWDISHMRLLVIKKIKNRSFSTSGSVSSSWSSTESENLSLSMVPNSISKNDSSSLYGSGSIAPSFSQSWQAESYDLWFFICS